MTRPSRRWRETGSFLAFRSRALRNLLVGVFRHRVRLRRLHAGLLVIAGLVPGLLERVRLAEQLPEESHREIVSVRARVAHPDVRLAVGAAVALAVDLDRHQRALDDVA